MLWSRFAQRVKHETIAGVDVNIRPIHMACFLLISSKKTAIEADKRVLADHNPLELARFHHCWKEGMRHPHGKNTSRQCLDDRVRFPLQLLPGCPLRACDGVRRIRRVRHGGGVIASMQNLPPCPTYVRGGVPLYFQVYPQHVVQRMCSDSLLGLNSYQCHVPLHYTHNNSTAKSKN